MGGLAIFRRRSCPSLPCIILWQHKIFGLFCCSRPTYPIYLCFKSPITQVMHQYYIQNSSVFDQNILFGSIHTFCGMPLLLLYPVQKENEFTCLVQLVLVIISFSAILTSAFLECILAGDLIALSFFYTA